MAYVYVRSSDPRLLIVLASTAGDAVIGYSVGGVLGASAGAIVGAIGGCITVVAIDAVTILLQRLCENLCRY